MWPVAMISFSSGVTPGYGSALYRFLPKGCKGSVIFQQKSRSVGLSYVAKEALQVRFGKGVQQVPLSLFSQASSRQAAEAPNQVPGTGPAKLFIACLNSVANDSSVYVVSVLISDIVLHEYGSLAPQPKHSAQVLMMAAEYPVEADRKYCRC